MTKTKILLMSIFVVIITLDISLARDLAGIEWEDFKNRSDFAFSGNLIKAEMLEDKLFATLLKIDQARKTEGRDIVDNNRNAGSLSKNTSLDLEIVYTYRVTAIFKGKKFENELVQDNQETKVSPRISAIFKETQFRKISFKAPMEENINKTIGTAAIVFLKKVDNEWRLSVDERCCWTQKSEMQAGSFGFPVYQIPTVDLYNFPKELGEKVNLMRRYQDGYHLEEVFVYPMRKVDDNLETFLNNKK